MSIFTKTKPTAAALETRIGELKNRLDTILPADIAETREAFAAALATGENVEPIKRRLFDLTQEAEALPAAIAALFDELITVEKTEAHSRLDTEKKKAARILETISAAWGPVVSAFEEFRAAVEKAGISELPGNSTNPGEMLARLSLPDFPGKAAEEVRLHFAARMQQVDGSVERRHRARLSA